MSSNIYSTKFISGLGYTNIGEDVVVIITKYRVPFRNKLCLNLMVWFKNIQKRKLQVDFYQNRILDRFALRVPKSVTLKQLTLFGRQVVKSQEKLLQSANYLREELPVRLAHRIRKFQQLPFVVGTNPQIESC
jgi:hypothetical protein